MGRVANSTLARHPSAPSLCAVRVSCCLLFVWILLVGIAPAQSLYLHYERALAWDATLQKRFAEVKVGMTEHDVRVHMGIPPDRNKDSRKDVWVYHLPREADYYMTNGRALLIIFKDGTVAGTERLSGCSLMSL